MQPEPSSTFPASVNERSLSVRWGAVTLLLLLVLACLVGLFVDTAWSIVSIWLRSDTFAHGFLIVPIALWLIWDKRAALRQISPMPTYVPVLLMLVAGLVWFVADAVDVLVLQQVAFVALLALAIWALIGRPAAGIIAFPIAFLFFAVPVGEALLHPLMDFTADFTVGMLRLTGIPVYREGNLFSIPSGDWSVVDACSGLRYLIASVTLGTLYAYLTYTKLWKRLLFVLVSVGVPILANGLRAYIIVMIAHLSDNKLAHGIDHFIYGWVFFGIVVTIMFIIGAFWRDPAGKRAVGDGQAKAAPAQKKALVVSATVLLAGTLWPVLAWTLATMPADSRPVDLELPQKVQNWRVATETPWGWRPQVEGPDGQLYSFYQDTENTPVGLYVGAYRTQRQGAEVLSSLNMMVRLDKYGLWHEAERQRRLVSVDGKEFNVNESVVFREGKRLLVWNWYRIGDRNIADPYVGKLVEAALRLLANRRDGALIAVATPYSGKGERSRRTLEAFLQPMLPHLESELKRALEPSP